jgi:hypothetical protein
MDDPYRNVEEAIWGAPAVGEILAGLIQIVFAVVLFVVGIFYRPNGRHRA